MGRFRRAKLTQSYLRWIAAASTVTLLLGLGIFTFAGGHTSWAMPWVVFAGCVGAASFATVLLTAGGAGPLARLALALAFFAAQLFVVGGGAEADIDTLGNGAGPLGAVWDRLGEWLSAYSLGLFDSVGWRLNLVLGLLLLMLYPVVRLVIAPVLSLVGKHTRSLILDMRGISAAPRGDDGEAFFANLPARHTMLFVTVVAIAFVILLPPVALAVDQTRIYGAASMIEAGEHVVWAGSLILLLELTALTFKDPPRAVEPATAGERDEVGKAPRLDELYARLRQVAGEHLLYPYSQPPQPSGRTGIGMRAAAAKTAATARRHEGPSALVLKELARLCDLPPATVDQLRGQLDDFLAPDVPATRMAIPEGLTATHYFLFAVLVSHTLDNGGTVVVIAPDELMPEVKANFQSALLKSGLSLAVTIFEATVNPPPEHELFNLVLVPASLFETGFLRYSDNYEGVLTRLSMIFLLEAADMDLGWLRLRLFSLWQLTSHDRTRVVMQSSTSRRLNEIVGMVATQGGKGERSAASLTPSAKKATRVLVFDDTAEFRAHLSAELFPGVRDTVPAALALAFESARFQCEPVVHRKSLDPAEAAQVESDWLSKVTDLGRDRAIAAIENGDAALGLVSGDLFRSHLRPTDAPATVIAWDTYNFIEVREHNYNFSGAPSFLVQILSKNYPMRKFLRDVEDSPSGSDHVGAQELLRRRVPRLAGGIAELAYATIHGMRRRQGLSRTQFKLILDTIPDRKLVESAGIGNDRSGIDRILQLHEIQSRVSVSEDVNPLTGERLFRVQTTGGPLDFFDPVRVTQGGVALPGNPLDYSDRGLTFGEQTNVRVGDKIWRVSSISRREITLTDPPGEALVNYVFVNRYVFRPEIAPIIEFVSADELERERTFVGTAILHLSYRRNTEEICSCPSGVEPFSRGGGRNSRLARREGWAVVDRNRQCVAHIVVNGLAASLPEGDRIGEGEPLAPEMRKATVALGVCTIIKDTIASLFPDLAHRIAVLSPQLSGFDRQLKTMVGNTGLDASTREDAEMALFLGERVGYVDGFDSTFFEAWAQPELRKVMSNRDDVLEILVVEDSDRDLGVARAVVGQAPNFEVLRAAAFFATDLEHDEEPESEGSYLRFGASKLSRFIYLKGATTLLRKLGRLPERKSEAGS
jgi:hypothetical protein